MELFCSHNFAVWNAGRRTFFVDPSDIYEQLLQKSDTVCHWVSFLESLKNPGWHTGENELYKTQQQYPWGWDGAGQARAQYISTLARFMLTMQKKSTVFYWREITTMLQTSNHKYAGVQARLSVLGCHISITVQYSDLSCCMYIRKDHSIGTKTKVLVLYRSRANTPWVRCWAFCL